MTLKRLATEQIFKEQILTGSTVKIVLFEATWHGSSQILIPILERIQQKLTVEISKVCIEENPMVAESYGIMKIPTILLFQEGKLIDHIVGIVPAIKIEAKILEHVSV